MKTDPTYMVSISVYTLVAGRPAGAIQTTIDVTAPDAESARRRAKIKVYDDDIVLPGQTVEIGNATLKRLEAQ